VLDISLPEPHRWKLLKELRAQSHIAILVVSQHQSPESRIEALDFGADDYLVKPIHHGELAARVRSVVRRRYAFRDRKRRVGRWTVDIDLRTVAAGETTSQLTRGEFEILAKLIEAGAKIVSREILLSAVSRRPGDADLRSIDTLISRLRRKLGDDQTTPALIVTAPGLGYRLGAQAEEV
jgi:two-component system torCAD operon response regulator TorR